MNAPELRRPIFIIGAARSGTTLLGDLLSNHPDVAYWVEPRYVWRHGAHGTKDDVRDADEATDEVAAYIRGRFTRFLKRAGRLRFMEKSPSNCFRISFMYRIFPDGCFIHLLRDGRDTAASALNRWRGRPDYAAMSRRLRSFEVPLSAIHHYLPELFRETVLRRLQPGHAPVWGPRYPGLIEEHRHESTVMLCAKQWSASVRSASRQLATLPQQQVLTVSYKSLVQDAAGTLDRIQRFADLLPDPQVAARAPSVQASPVRGFDQLSREEREVIERVCLPVMKELDCVFPN